MASFLYRVANTYFEQFDSEISRFTFVFPNRRAGLFFRQYLADIAVKPVFSPEIITIDECFASASSYQSADRLSNLFRIYTIYRSLNKKAESFDSFVFWGEMLLADFDEVDKYRVDARQLFTNITELKEIDSLFNIFTAEQLEAIQQFWKNFIPVTEGKTSVEFLSTWKILYEIYNQFHTELKSVGLATDGMICREVVDRLIEHDEIDVWNNKKFVFVGFNALNPCEKKLMYELKKRNMADFYWDYEAGELRDNDNPASLFYEENTRNFPSKFEIKTETIPLSEKITELIAVPSSVGQTKQVYSILNRLFPADEQNKKWLNTAVVLPDENLLIPLLHAIPEQIQKINVTMGYPLKITPVFNFIESIFQLQQRLRSNEKAVSFYFQTVYNILNHQFIILLCENEVKEISKNMVRYNMIYVAENDLKKNELLSLIFSPQNDIHSFITYLLRILLFLHKELKIKSAEANNVSLDADFLYQYYITINRISGIIDEYSPSIELNTDTLIRLIKQLTSGITIPFEGEPLEGLQIMGMLEARGIDFENLIITTFNEGVFPNKNNTNSFIPYHLRKGFGLATFEHHDAISSYNFYRLIHRAKRIFYLYDSRTDGMQTGEISRYIYQLKYHYGLDIRVKNVNFDISFGGSNEIKVNKSPEILEKLRQFLVDNDDAPSLSASSIKSYIDCPLQFYLTRIEKLEQADELKETIEESMFGNLFHATMEYLYLPYKAKMLNQDDIDNILNQPLYIEKQIKKAFCKKYFRISEEDKITLEGNNLLIANVIAKYVRQVLRNDKMYAPFRFIDAEKVCKLKFPISNGEVNLKGIIDRIDEKEGKIRILDYKTGAGNLEFKSWEEVFEHNNDKRPKYVLQTFLYGLFYKKEAAGKTMSPGIYYMRNVFKDGFVTEMTFKPEKNVKIVIDDFSAFEEEFTSKLKICIEEIFNPEVPFFQTTSQDPCKYCSYTSICNR